MFRQYQHDLKQAIYAAWQSNRVVLGVLPTGGGKTHVFSEIVTEVNQPTCVIAHRKEIVGQISCALARSGVKHRIIGPKDNSMIKSIVGTHVRKFGKDFYDPRSHIAVAGVDTLIKRQDVLARWLPTVKLVVMDEGHHVLAKNKWGTAMAMFPNAYGLLVTATPCRADGRGLGRHADGFVDEMVLGPSMRDLINAGYLTDYYIKGVFTDIDLSQVDISANGDYNPKRLKIQVRKSRIVGDVVEQYKRHIPGMSAVTFATDVETAKDFVAAFNASGIPAELISAKTHPRIRESVLQKLANKQILQVVNVDILGEGFDCPAIEAIQMARPTKSFSLYCQQFGRALRPDPENPNKVAVILDHVGNVTEHLLPDIPKFEWTLDSKERQVRSADAVPIRICPNPECTKAYEAFHKVCPYCGYAPQPKDRSKPEFVDGDLTELNSEMIALMYGKIEQLRTPSSVIRDNMLAAGAPKTVAYGAAKQHRLRAEAQERLCEQIAIWAGIRRYRGVPDSKSYREFYHKFGVDVLTAQTLGRPKAEELTNILLKENSEGVSQ